MEPGWTARAGAGQGGAEGIFRSAVKPLVRPAPRSAMFFPLVVVVAVLPGLYALSRWDLNPPGPWWGLRSLAVLEGQPIDQVPAALMAGPESEAMAFRVVALQPPLYAWLGAAGLTLSANRAPLATVLPSYVAGALVVVLVYLHGRLWRGPGLGLVAAILTGFNPHLLTAMQQATPTTLGLAGTLLALYSYGLHQRSVAAGLPRIGWALVGGIALGLSFLAAGPFPLAALPIIVLHQVYLGPAERPGRWWRMLRAHPSVIAGALALAIGLGLAAPWYAHMSLKYHDSFWTALLVPPDVPGVLDYGFLGNLIALAPVTLPLGLYAAAHTFRPALRAEADDQATVGSVFWTLWLGVAILLPGLWPEGPRTGFGLFLLVPLNLLAAQVITELASRRMAVRSLIWLAPLTIFAFAWWASAPLRAALAPLGEGRWPEATTALGLHLAADLLLAVALLMRGLTRWARRRDARQRLILGGFLAAIVAVTTVTGIREVRFRHRETKDLLILREVILRLHQDHPFTLVAVVGPQRDLTGAGPLPGGRLRFILKTALPRLPQMDLTRSDDLLNLPDGQRLVILVGQERLPYALQARLGLWAIHPGRSGVLDAFATAHDFDLDQPLRR